MAVTAEPRTTSPGSNARAQRRLARARGNRNRQILYRSLVTVIVGGLAALILWAILAPQPGEHVAS
jgi:hypothetical protein